LVEYLAKGENDAQGAATCPCIRDEGGNLPGESIPGNVCFSAPIYDASSYFGICDPTRWVLVGPTLWQAACAIAWLEFDPVKTKSLRTSQYVQENHNGNAYFGRPTMILDYHTTMNWAGLKVSREFAFKWAIKVVSATSKMLPDPEQEEEETRKKAEQEEAARAIKKGTKKQKVEQEVVSAAATTEVVSAKPNKYWISSMTAVDNPTSVLLTNAKNRKKVQIATLNEYSGYLMDAFIAIREWEFFLVPPYPPQGTFCASTPANLIQENQFYARNKSESAIAENEKFITENWIPASILPEAMAIRIH